MRSRSPVEIGVIALLTVIVVIAVPRAQAAKTRGAATPQETIAALKKAIAASDIPASLSFISPNGLKELAVEGVTGLLMVLAFSDPDDAMPGAPKLSKAELDAKRKNYKEAVALTTQTLKPYGLDTLIGEPVLATPTQNKLTGALAKADTYALLTSLSAAMAKIGPLLTGKADKARGVPFDLGNVTNYKITGDKATAQNGAETIAFSKIDGRWFMDPPSKNGGTAAPSPAPPGQRQTAAGAPQAAASGANPQIVAGGIQIARVVVSNDDFSAKPFHSDNGTTLILWVKMPAGQGLIEIDEDTSLLQKFSDDKGTNIGGKFGSFPEEFKDGTGGIIEVKSSGLPAAGATALLAEGSLSMTVASGTRKTRVANVSLKNDTKFMLGATSITIAEVEADGENQTFTLKLPRQVMAGIKNVAFFDAKGAPVEGRRTSSGYMNDAAELGFSVKTPLKTLTLEFEAWQGLRTIKVPFNIKAGLGL
jgi:hypothetical protein